MISNGLRIDGKWFKQWNEMNWLLFHVGFGFDVYCFYHFVVLSLLLMWLSSLIFPKHISNKQRRNLFWISLFCDMFENKERKTSQKKSKIENSVSHQMKQRINIWFMRTWHFVINNNVNHIEIIFQLIKIMWWMWYPLLIIITFGKTFQEWKKTKTLFHI